MTTISTRSLPFAALVLVTLAGTAAGQTTSSAVLNSLQVKELLTRAEPADHARLGAHFAALAERYAADSGRHTAMAGAFIATPARRTAANSAADHCKRLARLNAESAAALTELATHHRSLSAGKTSVAPKGAARFEGGAGAPAPSADELRALAAKAATPADHRALDEYFRALAKRYAAEANDHATMAQAYRGTRITQAAAHCDRLVALARESAKVAAAAADIHKPLAGEAR